MKILGSFLLLAGIQFISAQDEASACADVSATCLMACDNGFKKDARGCDICECEEDGVCQDVQCTVGKVCKAYTLTSSGHKISRCVDPRLPATCQPAVDTGPCRAMKEKVFYNTETDKCEPFFYGGCKGNDNLFGSIEECNVNCVCALEPQCAMACDYGYKKDERGCNKCECAEASEVEESCSPISCLMHCENGFKKDARGCDICQCEEEVCAEIQCRMFCEYGYEKDARGCDLCKCKDPVPMPRRSCEPVQCRMYCEGGYKVDARGCDICQCQEPTVPESCPDAMCYLYCQHGFKRDVAGCERCECVEPVQIKAFSECSEEYAVSCQMSCDHGFKRNEAGCPTCECYEPVDCSERIMCAMFCPAGFRKDADGCDTCKCIDPVIDPVPAPIPRSCESVQCRMFCEHGYKVDTRGCDICQCQEPTIPESCSPVMCHLYCQHGFKRDVEGCEQCACAGPVQINPLSECSDEFAVSCLMSCDQGFKRDEAGCPTCECYEPVDCAQRIMCAMFCPAGFRKDADGCDICKCIDPIIDPVPEFPPQCQNDKQCRMYCEHGFRRDISGCTVCECQDSPCDDVDCQVGHKCSVEVGGFPKCIREEVRTWCPHKLCRMYCEHGYRADQYGCEKCECVEEPAPDCPEASCRQVCPFGFSYDDFGCRSCQCLPDPCSIKGCDRMHVCEVKEADCPLCPAIGICIGHAQVQRIRIELYFNHDEIETIDFEDFGGVFRHRMKYLLGIDEEYIKGVAVTTEGPSRTHVVFHAVSYGAGDIVTNYESFERDIKSHQEGTSLSYGDVVFIPEHRTLQGAYFRDPEFDDDWEDEFEDEIEANNIGVIVGCSIAGAVALALLITVIVFVVKAKKKGSGRPKVSYKKAPGTEAQPEKYEKKPLPDDNPEV